MLARLSLLLAILLLTIAPAWAHAQLLSTDPADSAVVDTAPEAVTLRFNEPVNPLAIRLVGPDGASASLEAMSSAETVTVPLPGDIANGTHVLSWRVVSTDGHPIGGALVFSIGAATGVALADLSTDSAVAAALWVSKALLFIAMFLGIGGAVFAAVTTLPPPARRLSTGLAALGVFITPISLGLHGLDALALPISAIFKVEPWSAGLSTSYGATVIACTLAFAWALGALCLPTSPVSRSIGLAAGTLAALSIALSGHASAAAPQWLTRPAVFLHMAGVLFWTGALLPLWLQLREKSLNADRALATFSRAIPYAVGALVLSGLALATIQMGLPGPQWLSSYGAILAAKLALLVILFGLALWNRFRLTAPALAGNAAARRQLRWSIGVEMAIVLAILALVPGWRFTPPPRALAAVSVPAEPLLVHLMDETTMAMVTVSPGATGPVMLDIELTDFEGTPLTPQAVSVAVSAPALGVEAIKRDAIEAGNLWRVEGLNIPIAGEWTVEVDIRASRFELRKLAGSVAIP